MKIKIAGYVAIDEIYEIPDEELEAGYDYADDDLLALVEDEFIEDLNNSICPSNLTFEVIEE